MKQNGARESTAGHLGRLIQIKSFADGLPRYWTLPGPAAGQEWVASRICALSMEVNEEYAMSDHDHDDENDPVPRIQKLLDNPFLLLLLGVLIPMIVYNLWGVIEILTVPVTR